MLTQENIPFLKRTLYEMDTLTEEENIEAKSILTNQISSYSGSSISIVDRLILMIRIKEQIVGRKKRRFYIEDDLFLSSHHGDTTHPEVFCQLINGKLNVTGGIEGIFEPYLGTDEEDGVVRRYHQKSIHGHRGHWEISRNFKELRFNYNSDKRWSDERTYYASIVYKN